MSEMSADSDKLVNGNGGDPQTQEVANLAVKYLNLLERLNKERESSGANIVNKLGQLHSEMSSLQDAFERCCMFKEGQTLHTLWLHLALNKRPTKGGGEMGALSEQDEPGSVSSLDFELKPGNVTSLAI